MNNGCYRLVFSKPRGMLVAVAETAIGHGKSNETKADSSRTLRSITLFAMRHAAFAATVLFGLAPAPSEAQIVPSGAHAPNVTSTANGLPQVNIVKPSGAGVSLNTYSQFDVGSGGAILNNASKIATTQLAGQITGNPNFGPNDAAKIIVNQVNSNNPSQLRGYVEVAGQKAAAVVIANASGLVVDGGGFINTSRGILTTGNPLIDGSGNLTGFNVTGGTIAVQGAGLNGSNLDQVDLLARAVQANAAIYANTLNVVAGPNHIDYTSVNPTSVAGSGAAPGVSIDVSQLGGMYANRITLVGNEQGVGVANAGTIAAQAGNLTLTSSGQLIQSGHMSATGNLALSAQGVANSGTVYAQQNATIEAAGALTNSGTIAAQRDAKIDAGSVASTGLLGAGINPDGTQGSSGNLTVTATGLLSATGQTIAPGAVTLYGASLELAAARLSAGSALALTAAGGNLDLARANATAGTTLTANATGTLAMRNAKLGSGAAMQLSGAQITNTGGQAVAGSTLTAQTAGTLDNQNGVLQAAGQATLDARSLDNTGGHVLSLNSDGLTIRATSTLTNGAGGVIGGNGDVSLSAAAITNSGQVSALGNAALGAQTISNNGGTVTAGGALTAHASGALSNVGGQFSASETAMSGASLDNSSGQINGAQVSVSTTDRLTNHNGTIQQSGTTDQTINAGGVLDNTGGTIATNAQNFTIDAQSITNDGGKVQHAGSGNLAIDTPGVLSNVAGRIATNGALTSQSASLDNRGGTLSAQHSTNISATNGIVNTSNGQIYGKTGLRATTQGNFDNTAGSAQSGGSLALDAGGMLSNAGGAIAANGASGTLAVTGSGIDNTSGTLTNAGTGQTTISATTVVTNTRGVLGGNGDVQVQAQTLANNGGAQLVAGGTANLNVTSQVDNTGGLLYGGTALNLNQPGVALINDHGRIAGNQDVSLAVGSMSNAGGKVNANRDINMSGTLSGGGAMTAGRDLTLALQGDFANDASTSLHADNDLTLGVTGTLTNTAPLEAGHALTVNAANVVNAAGADMNSAATTVRASNDINNAGVIEGDNVTTRSVTLENSGALIGNRVIVNAGDISNDGTQALIAGATFVGIYAVNSLANTSGALIYSAGNMELARDNARDSTGMLANQTGTITNSASTIEAAGNIDVAATALTNQRTGVQTEAGVPVTTTGPTLTFWTAGISVDNLGWYVSATYPQWRMRAGAIGTASYQALTKPLIVTLPASQVTNINSTDQTFSLTQPLSDTYVAADSPTVEICNNHCTTQKVPQTRTITNNPTQYYQSLTQNADGTVTISFYPDFDPNKNILPTQAQLRTDLKPDSHDYVEMSRTVTTTTSTDQLLKAGTAAIIQAQGTIRINADHGAINNNASTMTAGGDLVRRATGGSINDNGIVLQQTGTQTASSVFYWHQKTGGSNDTQTVNGAAVPLPTTTVAALPAIATSNQTVQTDAQTINIGSVNRIGQTVTGAGVAGGDATGTHTGSVSADGKRPQTLGSAGVAIPGLVLPNNALYSYQSAPNAPYLVETDPRFTSYAKFISSDYMLGALGLNPQNVQKRLGDGLYEQQLVMNQVTQLTGRTLLGSSADNLDEYTALMNNGVHYAQSFGLSVGIALTPAQMAALTTDMVWLVSQTVTLPNGTQQRVLVPQLYLAQSSTVDLQASGALVAGKNVNVNATGDVTNSGHVAGDIATTVIGNNVVNRGVIGSGGTSTVAAVQDVSNVGGRIGGVDTVVTAGRDIVNQSTLAHAAVTTGNAGFTSSASGMAVDSVGTISATNSATLIAGHDVKLAGAAIQTGGDANVAAGHDINVGTTTLAATQDAGTTDGLNGGHTSVTRNVGSTITTGGNLTTASGHDTTLTDAQVQAGGNATMVASGNLTVTAAKDTASYNGQSMGGALSRGQDRTYDESVQGSHIDAGGNVALTAGQGGAGNLAVLGSSVTTGGAKGGSVALQSTGDIVVGAVSEQHDAQHWSQNNHSGFLSSEKITDTSSAQQSIAVGSTVSGNTVGANAGHDLSVAGSTVASTGDMALSAGHDLNITTTQNTSQSNTSHENQRSGFGALSGGGVSINYGKSDTKLTTHDSSVTNNGSLVGSIDGSVAMTAGNNLGVTGSQVIAAQNLTGTAANVTIDAATDTSHHDQAQEMKQSGFTLGLAGSVGDAINGAIAQGQAIASGNSDGRATALHTIAAAGNAAMAGIGAAGLMKGATGPGAPSIGVQLSFGASQSKSNASEDQKTQKGSTLQAGASAALVATGNSTPGSGNVTIAGSDVSAKDVLIAAKNQVDIVNTTSTDSTRSSNSSSSASVGVSLTTQGYGVSASMSNAHGDANSDAAMQNNSHVSAANSVTVVSGGDTNIIGSDVAGGKVTANVGGDLNVRSVQDVTTSAAHQSSVSGGFTISQGGGSASFSAQNGHADGSYAGVKEQAGIHAGDGGFDVSVKGNTALTGAVISSTAEASKNSLSTGTLTYSDIQNESHYDATSNGVSAGVGIANTGKALGPGSVSGSGGVVPMMTQNASGDSSATTRSAVSAGTIGITSQAAQTQEMAGLSRDTANTNGTVSNTPNVSAFLSRQADTMQAAQAAAQVVAQGIGAYADSKRDAAAAAVEAAAKSKDPQAMAAALADYTNWREGGDSRAALQAGGGALIGGLGGGAIGAFAGAAGAAISSKLADQTKAATDAVTAATGSSLIGSIGGNILSGLAGGMIGGSAGAAMASNVDLYNQSNDRESAAMDARVKGIVSQALGNRPDFDSVSVGTLIDQYVGLVKSGAKAKMSEPRSDLVTQGVVNGLNAVVGMGGGKPPTASPGAAAVDSVVGQATAAGVSSGNSVAGYWPGNATFAKGDNEASASSTDNGGASPPNMSPDGAGRNGAFNEAKRNAGVPVSQQPVEIRPNVDRQGNVQPGYQYVYEVPSEGGGTKEVIIRDDAGGHSFGKNDPQNRGAHFNDPAGNHYDY